MADCAPALTAKPIPGICGRDDGSSLALPIISSVRPQSPTGRPAPVSVKDAAGAHRVVLFADRPADQVEAVIDYCWRRGMGVGPTQKAVKWHTKFRPDFETVRRRFVMLADAFCSGPP